VQKKCSYSGLTGGISSVQSSVAAMLRELSSPSSMPTPWLTGSSSPANPPSTRVLQEFGQAVVAPDGRVNRAKLSAIVFADRARLDRLNAIVHPRVAAVVFRQFEEWQRGGTRDAAFVEAALLIESGIHKNLDGLVVAWCEPEQQLERLMARWPQRSRSSQTASPRSFPSTKNCVWPPKKYRLFRLSRGNPRQVEALAAKLRRNQTVR